MDIFDEFLSTHDDRLITDPLKRAVLQRDLWARIRVGRCRDFGDKAAGMDLDGKLASTDATLGANAGPDSALPDTDSAAVNSHSRSQRSLRP